MAQGATSPAAAGSATFVEGAAAAGLVYAPLGRAGAAVGDADGDGWQDVVLTGGPSDGVKLFRNQQDGTFADVTATSLPLDCPKAWEAQLADLDGDGDEDLALLRWYDAGGLDCGFWWLENDGSGLFDHGPVPTDLARSADLGASLAAGDTDGDGDLDVVLLHNNGPGWHLVNDGAGNFTDGTVAFAGGLATVKRHWSGPLGDFDRDLDLDLHVAIDGGHDYHARNLGGGSFQDVSTQVGVSNLGSDMGVATGDFDHDGDIDLYSTNIGFNVLYVNDGAGNFVDEANARGVRASSGFPQPVGWGTVFADLDNDGDEDLVYVVSNFVQGVWGKAFLNDGAGQFTDGTAALGLASALGGRALAAFDFDRDGDLDLLANGYAANARLFVNQLDPQPGGGADWLQVELVGRASAPHGIGAWIEAEAGGVTRTRHVTVGASMNTGVPMRQHLGLGASTAVERLLVTWPDGTRQELRDVAAGQVLRIRQLTALSR